MRVAESSAILEVVATTESAPVSKSAYPRGSEWRRWDPHVHSPASALANQFSDWNTYIAALEAADGSVAAIGITDYCSVEGYRRVLDFRAKGRLKNFTLVFPNIEFRITPELPAGGAINIHLLVDPSDAKHLERIESALRLLTFKYNGNPYSCDRSGLINLGRAHDPSKTTDEAAFRHGVNNFKPDFTAFQEWYLNQGWLRDNSLVAISNAKDGASGLSKDAGFAATRDELYRFSQLLFSGNPKDREYFLGKGTDSIDEVIRKCGGLMPCIHGSDAHETSRLFEVAKQRYCWIKADPTFEGLRQLQHEPEDRVFIGPSSPAPVDQSKIIRSVRLVGADDWFADSQIELNSGLVGVIGEKGSGKTALAELIAFACSAWRNEKSSSSFVNKAGKAIEKIIIEIQWADGRKTTRRIGDGPNGAIPVVRYLSQDFVEELCSRDVTGNALIRQIEEVIFSYIGEEDRLEASSFEVLRRVHTDSIERKKTETRERLATLNREIVDLEDQLASKAEKQKQIQKLDDDIAAIDAQVPALQTTVDQGVADKIRALSESFQTKSADLAGVNRRLARIAAVKERAADFVRGVETDFLDLQSALEEAGLSTVEIEAFRPKFSDDRDVPFAKLTDALREHAQSLRGDDKNPSTSGDAIADLNHQLAELKKLLATDEQQRERLLALQGQRAKAEADKQRLAKEIERLDTKVVVQLNAKREARWKAYVSFFGLLSDEATTLAKLYDPLKKVIAEDASGAKTGFELNVRRMVRTNDWTEAGLNLFDKRKKVGLLDAALMSEVTPTLTDAWKKDDRGAIRASLERFLNGFGQVPGDVDALLVSHANRERMYNWVFSTDYVTLEYGLRYNGSDLDVLSPGTRGIVLLVLYLAMDVQDRRPLIIDQPEGNLDNSSIYEALVPFLRKAKHARQIILVTHNPNLVVTTDADQVVVARAARTGASDHPVLSYSSGALEFAGTEGAIREQAVRLLEGGSKPFKTRENRYALRT